MRHAHYQVLSRNPIKRFFQAIVWVVQSELKEWREGYTGGAVVTAAGIYVV